MNLAESVPFIAEGIIFYVFKPSIEDTWEIPEKSTHLVHGRQNLSQNLIFLYHYRTIPNGSLSTIIFRGKRNDP
jgi:hypothetical protein